MKHLITILVCCPSVLFAQRDSTKYLDSLCLPLQNRVKSARSDYVAKRISKASYDAAVNAFILCRDEKNNYLKRKDEKEKKRKKTT
jgi:hypothetical protein